MNFLSSCGFSQAIAMWMIVAVLLYGFVQDYQTVSHVAHLFEHPKVEHNVTILFVTLSVTDSSGRSSKQFRIVNPVGNDNTASHQSPVPTAKKPSQTNDPSRNNTKGKQSTKTPKTTQTAYRDPPLTKDSRILMYVHVGKTGGYTLDAVLYSNCAWYGLKEPKTACFANLRNTSSHPTSMGSYLSFHTRSTLHLDPRRHYQKWIDNTTTFLVSIRNPIDRAVSAFDMDHTLNNNLHDQPLVQRKRRQFYGCFRTAEDVAQALLPTTLSGNQTKCSPQVAHQVLTGTYSKRNINTHLEYNYQFYKNMTFGQYPNKEIMVVRTENLWDDIGGVDRLLGGNGTLSQTMAGHHFDHGSSDYVVKSKLTTEGRRIFCDALQQEIDVYSELVERAVNLEEWEKRETLEKLQIDCSKNAISMQ
ncbi:sulfotransferase family protein [Nitzschia inconspicua]|uniref:Sulfotransferase family protein n=1 Tax=Nitzschia inconspicua TaxID=303405 RepID=A0A9K3M102_9STRA|nr:sulfotransferase family protein [Nitzschia inconspicua]